MEWLNTAGKRRLDPSEEAQSHAWAIAVWEWRRRRRRRRRRNVRCQLCKLIAVEMWGAVGGLVRWAGQQAPSWLIVVVMVVRKSAQTPTLLS